MHEVVIRERQAADLEGCVAMLRAVHETDGYPLNWPADPAQWLTPAGLTGAWIAELPSGILAGHVAIQKPTADTSPEPSSDAFAGASSDSAELSRLFVAPAARRRSIAAALLAHAETWATEHQHTLRLTVTDERRSAAVALYEAAGWHHTRTSAATWTTADGRPVRLRHYRR